MISIRYGRLLGKPNEMFVIVIVSLTGFPPTGMLVLYGQHGSMPLICLWHLSTAAAPCGEM